MNRKSYSMKSTAMMAAKVSGLVLTMMALALPVDARGRNDNAQQRGNTPKKEQMNRPAAPQRGRDRYQPQRPAHAVPVQRPQRPNQVVPGHIKYHRPERPMMPAHRPWHRPTPPPAFRPSASWRPFRTILGVSLGSTISFAINTLYNNGYCVSGYTSDAVYLANVPMLNLVWPDATLFYGTGGLCASEFVYSTPGYDLGRYNSVYRSLVQSYGMPVQQCNGGGVMSASWWGTGGQFITLSFQRDRAFNGATRFYTTLSFGN